MRAVQRALPVRALKKRVAITSTRLPHVWEMLIRQLIQNPVRLLGKGAGGGGRGGGSV